MTYICCFGVMFRIILRIFRQREAKHVPALPCHNVFLAVSVMDMPQAQTLSVFLAILKQRLH